MRCEEAQVALAEGTRTSVLTEAVASHVRGCLACQQIQLVYDQMTESLEGGRPWQPPPGFARTVAARGLQELQREQPAEPRWRWRVVRAGIWAVSGMMAAYLGVRVVGLFEPIVASVSVNALRTLADADAALVRLAMSSVPVNDQMLAWVWVASAFILAGLLRPWRRA